MHFRSRRDGSHFPMRPKASTDMSQLRAQGKHWNRTIAKSRLATLKTLENPLLWSNFKKKYEALNPDFDLDSFTDRTLEPEEALKELMLKHPGFVATDKPNEIDFKAEFRQDLEDRGITNEKVQNLIAKADDPLTEDEIAEVAGALNTRSDHAVEVDKALKAPLTEDVRKWAKNPTRFDIKSVDDPASK